MKKISANTILKNLAFVAIILMTIFVIFIYFSGNKKARETKEYEKFLVVLDQYEQVIKERNDCYWRIYDAWGHSGDLRSQKIKDLNSFYYLLWRLEPNSKELEPIEYELRVLEVQCISYMNKLCEIAYQNARASEILRLRESYELYFYDANIDKIKGFYKNEADTLKLDSLNTLYIQNVFNGKIQERYSWAFE